MSIATKNWVGFILQNRTNIFNNLCLVKMDKINIEDNVSQQHCSKTWLNKIHNSKWNIQLTGKLKTKEL